MTNNTLVQNISNPPIWSQVSNEKGVASIDYERFFNSIQRNLSNLINLAQPYILVNPDFNVLTASGYTPVTQADPDLTFIVSNWMVSKGAGNAFTITPTAYSNSQRPISGSNNFINVSIPTLTSTVGLYNQNYSTTGQFRGDAYNGALVTFSAVINNNNLSQVHAPALRFSAFTTNYGLTKGNQIYLQKGINYLVTSLQMPSLNVDNLGSNPYTQFRFDIENAHSEALDFDIYYLKAEISDKASPLIVNHIAEQFVCNNLV